MDHVYLYGIIEGQNGGIVAPSGVDGANTVYTIVGDGLGCVVSDYRGEEFGEMSKEKLVRCLLAHQQAVEHVMQDHTVLPAKFGTLLNNPREVNALLSQGRSQFLSALASIRGKVEIEVAATWDTGRVLQQLSQEEELVRVREAIARKGQPTMEERIQLGQMVKAYMDKLRYSYRKQMIGFLQGLSDNLAANALVSDAMVMNVAFLVDRAQQQEFDDRVRRLDELFHNQIAFRVIGPLPPYSFSTVEVTRLTWEQIETARQTLQMGDIISEVEIRNRYRHLAAETQRHGRPGNKLSDGQLPRLKQALELLLRYCRAREDGLGEGIHTLASGDADSLFHIALIGSRSDEIESACFGGSERL